VTLAQTLAPPYVATTAPHACPPWATECLLDEGEQAHRRRIMREGMKADVELYHADFCIPPLGVWVNGEEMSLDEARVLSSALIEAVVAVESLR
jgi:hypothetical protein